MRELVAEHHLRVSDLVAPLFVREGIDEPQPIASLPGVVQHTRSSLRAEVAALAELGVRAVILFGVPASKDATGSGAYDPDGIVQVALRDLRDDLGDDIVVMADLCVDEYTDHGHCGIVDGRGSVNNDATLDVYVDDIFVRYQSPTKGRVDTTFARYCRSFKATRVSEPRRMDPYRKALGYSGRRRIRAKHPRKGICRQVCAAEL